MPSGDRTGPEGLGPRTGRGLGYCNDYITSGYYRGTPRGGGGFGRRYDSDIRRGFGRGLGIGRRRTYNPVNGERNNKIVSKQDEKAFLENVLVNLEEELKQVKSRLVDLKNIKKE